jgi:hypothetical protein
MFHVEHSVDNDLVLTTMFHVEHSVDNNLVLTTMFHVEHSALSANREHVCVIKS